MPPLASEDKSDPSPPKAANTIATPPSLSEATVLIESSQAKGLGNDECWNLCGSPCATNDSAPVCPSLCANHDDCAPDELCLTTRPTPQDTKENPRPPRCQKSHCYTDEDCRPGSSCIATQAEKTTVYTCEKSGTRRQGEPCMHDEYDSSGLCERGTRCIGGTCVTKDPCFDDEDCGLGAQCHNAYDGDGICLPGCKEDVDCPTDQECLENSNGSRECLLPSSLGCLASGCPEGQECSVFHDTGTLKITACMTPCIATSDCEDGEVCGSRKHKLGTHCYQKCEDTKCEDGWLCTRNGVQAGGEDVIACRRDTARATEDFLQQF